MSSSGPERGEEELDLGHHGAGDDCITKVVTYGGNSALIGKAAFLLMSFNWNIHTLAHWQPSQA